MDPNVTLSRIRECISRWRMVDNEEEQVEAMSDALYAFEDLDEWMGKGGFPPGAWTEAMKLAAVAVMRQPTPPPRPYRHRPLIVPPEPLGGPVPGVGGSHLPEEGH